MIDTAAQGAAEAAKARRFIEALTHTKGRWAGQPFRLLPWQTDVVDQTFGVLRAPGRRQYRTVFVEIPKKNGKTEIGAAIGLKMLVADNEQGAEVYSAAADREQAGLVYAASAAMVRANKVLNKRLKVIDSRKRIVDYKTNSFYQVLSAESFTKHGINPSAILFDEIHAQPSRELWDVLTEGTDYAREQQLVFVMTTAGEYDPESIGWEVHDYARQVRDGIIEDDSFLPFIYAAPDDADWQDETVWLDANPSAGHIFDLEKIRADYQRTLNNPARIPNFRRFRLNQWVSLIGRFLDMDAWDKCNQPPAIPPRAVAYGALDLSSTTDMTAFVVVAEIDGVFHVEPRFYMPSDNIRDREIDDKVPYRLWADSGLLTLTPGKRVDYRFVARDVVAAAARYNLAKVGFDPWGASKLCPELQDDHGIEMVEFRQGYRSMSEPTKELLAITLEGNMRHGGHRVLRWNADNLRVKSDDAENVKPVKSNSRARIDGVVATIMALWLATVERDQASIYDSRGVLTV